MSDKQTVSVLVLANFVTLAFFTWIGYQLGYNNGFYETRDNYVAKVRSREKFKIEQAYYRCFNVLGKE